MCSYLDTHHSVICSSNWLTSAKRWAARALALASCARATTAVRPCGHQAKERETDTARQFPPPGMCCCRRPGGVAGRWHVPGVPLPTPQCSCPDTRSRKDRHPKTSYPSRNLLLLLTRWAGRALAITRRASAATPNAIVHASGRRQTDTPQQITPPGICCCRRPSGLARRWRLQGVPLPPLCWRPAQRWGCAGAPRYGLCHQTCPAPAR